VRLPRNLEAATGTAGSPTALRGAGDYRWSEVYPALYSTLFETTLVKLTTDSGLTGWGEAQAPLVPEVACTIIDRLLAPVVQGCEFDGSREAVEALWLRMYSTMRVRGQTGGFMLDAISGIDIALWDLAGKLAGKSVASLLGATRARIPAYVSGLPASEKLAAARRSLEDGFQVFKLYHDGTERALLDTIDQLRAEFGASIGIAVDALWRLDAVSAPPFGEALDQRGALWLECPLPPEDPEAHARLAAQIKTPIALGESYRSRFELLPFFRLGALRFLQPDLGRCGITESLRLARMAAEYGVAVVPHISIAMGPQIAAAIHFAAAAASCDLLEYNPAVFATANRFLPDPLRLDGARYIVPQGPGLGVDLELPAGILSSPR